MHKGFIATTFYRLELAGVPCDRALPLGARGCTLRPRLTAWGSRVFLALAHHLLVNHARPNGLNCLNGPISPVRGMQICVMTQKTNAAIAAAGQGARSSLRGSRGEQPPGGARRSGDLRAHKRARSGGVKGSTKPPAQSALTGSMAKAVLWKTAARSRAEEVAPDQKLPPSLACQTSKNGTGNR